jgi:hypothetical protein
MAIVILDPNESFNVANNGDDIRGRGGGDEALVFFPQVIDIEVNAEIETFNFPYDFSELVFETTENGLEVIRGDETIVTIPSLNQSLDLRVADGNIIISQTGAQEFTLENPLNTMDTVLVGSNPVIPDINLGENSSSSMI